MALLKGESGVYWNTLLRSMAMNLASFFISIYIYKVTGEIKAAFLFYGIVHLMTVLAALPAGWLTQRAGVDITALLGTILRALFMVLLILGKNNFNYLIWAAVCWGVMVPVFWLPYHYMVVGTEYGWRRLGKDISLIKIFEQLAGSLGPLIGGIIIVQLGFPLLYIIAIVLTLTSAIPLFLDAFDKKDMRFDLGQIGYATLDIKNRGFITGFIGVGLHDVVDGVAWPLFIYIVIGNIELIGLIQTGALIIGLVLLWWLGRRIDKKGAGILRWGAVINGLVWLVRSFIITPLGVFISNVAYGLGNLLWLTPFDTLMYEAARTTRRLEFFIIREITIHSGSFLACCLVWKLLKWGFGWFWVFGVALISLIMVSLVSREEKIFHLKPVFTPPVTSHQPPEL